MRKQYITPEFEIKHISLLDNVLETSKGAEIDIPVIDDTLPRDDNDW